MNDWAVAYFVSEWAIRLIMLVYVPQRRSPAAARTWLLFIFVLPWPGLLIYSLFGRAYLPRRRHEMQQEVSHVLRTRGRERLAPYAAHPQLPPQFVPAVQLGENLGDFTIVGGNGVELLTEYKGAIDRLVTDIAAARHHVHLLYYIFADDATGRRVADAVVAAAARGVSCRVLIDSLGSRFSRRALERRLRPAGVEVLEVLPVGLLRLAVARLDLRNHRKLAVIDGQIAYVGSQNLVNAKYKEGITYEELVARVTGPVVLQLQAVFLADRHYETDERLDLPEYFPDPLPGGDVAAQALPSGPGYPQANNQRLIVALLYAAQRRVVITTPYFIPDDALMQALQAAAQRGVEVHLVMSRKADQLLVSLAQRSYYEELLESGIQIHLYKRRFLHAKHLSVDDAVFLIGSSNMDLRSFLLNAELSLVGYDPPTVAALRRVQERTMAAADRLTLEEWRQRSFLTKTMQNLARLLDALL